VLPKAAERRLENLRRARVRRRRFRTPEQLGDALRVGQNFGGGHFDDLSHAIPPAIHAPRSGSFSIP
jgi:hypothetical protein